MDQLEVHTFLDGPFTAFQNRPLGGVGDQHEDDVTEFLSEGTQVRGIVAPEGGQDVHDVLRVRLGVVGLVCLGHEEGAK